MPASKRVLVIGIGGGTLDLLAPWAESGRLPYLARLMENGTHGRLASTLQPTTAPAWVTFMTGRNQGKHGLYDFVRRRPGTYDLEVTNASHIVGPTMFDIACSHGLRVITVNIPYTSPPRPVNGVSIGGPFAPSFSRDLVFPPGFYDEMKAVVPDYFVLPDYDSTSSEPLSDFGLKLLRGIELRQQLCLHLLETRDWDLFAVVFMASDEAQHTFWGCQHAPEASRLARHRDVIQDVYERIDEAVGVILDRIACDGGGQDTTVIILSDHGAGPFRLMINLNAWLAERGYLRYRTDRTSSLHRLWAETVKRLAAHYRDRVPSRTRAYIRSRMGTERFERVKSDFESTLLTSCIAWDQTEAYALGAGGNIFVNLKGRDPSGIVEPGTPYRELRERLISDLMTLSDPETGQTLIDRVYRREELYHGVCVDQGPDLIIQWKDYACWGRGRYDSHGPIFQIQDQFDFSRQPLTGSHRLDGLLIAEGLGIEPGTRLEGAHLLDLAPTILSLLDISPGDDLDGHILRAIASEAEEGAERGSRGTQGDSVNSGGEIGYTDEETEIISERLRSLGYL